MKVEPLRRYRTPRYPTRSEAEADPALLEALPARRETCAHLASLLGTGLAAQLILAGCRGEVESETDAARPGQVAPRRPGDRPPRGARTAVNDEFLVAVAPMLEEALASDGRGGFGCVVVDPPEFLSEEEALDIIRKRLSAAGLLLAPRGGALRDLRRPITTYQYDPRLRGRTTSPAPFALDGATADGRVVFEYVSFKDFKSWMDDKGPGGTVIGVDLSGTACRLAAEMANARASQRRWAGVFFDPMVSPDRDAAPRPVNDAGEAAWKDYGRKVKNDFRARAAARLELQVDAFLQYLRREGVLRAGDKRPSKPAPAVREPGWYVAARTRLDKRISFDLKKAPLSDVFDYLAEAAGMRATLGRNVPRERLVSLQMKDIPLELALYWATRLNGLDWEVREGGIAVDLPRELKPRTEKAAYPAGDLICTRGTPYLPAPRVSLAGLRDGPDAAWLRPGYHPAPWTDEASLVETVKRTVRPASWGPGCGASIEPRDGTIFVTARPEIHRGISEALARLRRLHMPLMRVEARFFAVEPGKEESAQRSGHLLAEATLRIPDGQRRHSLRGRNWPSRPGNNDVFTGVLLDARPILSPDRRAVTLTAGLGLWLPVGKGPGNPEQVRVFRAPLSVRLTLGESASLPVGVMPGPRGGTQKVIAVLGVGSAEPGGVLPVPAGNPVPGWESRLRKAMDKRVSVDFKEKPFEECIDHLRTRAGFTVILDDHAFRHGADPKKPVTLSLNNRTLGEVLHAVARANRMECKPVEGVLLIANTWEVSSIQAYDLKELALPAPDCREPDLDERGFTPAPEAARKEKPIPFFAASSDPRGVSEDRIRDVMMRSVAPREWGVGMNSISTGNGHLLVVQRPEVLARIGKLLGPMRLAFRPEVRVTADFYSLPAEARPGGPGEVRAAGKLLSSLATVGQSNQTTFAAGGLATPGSDERAEHFAGAILETRPGAGGGADRSAEAAITWIPEGGESARLRRTVKLPWQGEGPKVVEIGESGDHRVVAVLQLSVRAGRLPKDLLTPPKAP